MPYIPLAERRHIDPLLDEFLAQPVCQRLTEGQLNYILSRVAIHYARVPGYSTYNEVLGVFDAASKEFYRRLVAPYEDQKIMENGDVYPTHRPPISVPSVFVHPNDERVSIPAQWFDQLQNTHATEDSTLTNADIDELAITDGHGNTWFRCPDEPDCDLHVTGPGRVFCAHCTPED